MGGNRIQRPGDAGQSPDGDRPLQGNRGRSVLRPMRCDHRLAQFLGGRVGEKRREPRHRARQPEAGAGLRAAYQRRLRPLFLARLPRQRRRSRPDLQAARRLEARRIAGAGTRLLEGRADSAAAREWRAGHPLAESLQSCGQTETRQDASERQAAEKDTGRSRQENEERQQEKGRQENKESQKGQERQVEKRQEEHEEKRQEGKGPKKQIALGKQGKRGQRRAANQAPDRVNALMLQYAAAYPV